MKIFGFDTSDPAGLQNAIKAANQSIQAVEPIIHTAEMRLGGILDTLLSRLDGATLTLHIPKAGANWEKTPPS